MAIDASVWLWAIGYWLMTIGYLAMGYWCKCWAIGYGYGLLVQVLAMGYGAKVFLLY